MIALPFEGPVAVSVVVPVLDEEGAVEKLAQEVLEQLDRLDLSFEILFVDDGSADGTVAAVERARRADARVCLVRHTRNCGQSAAVASGFHLARGEIVVTLDGDGQNDPGDIPALLDLLNDADAACGVRRARQDTFVRRASSRIANSFRNFITGDRLEDAGCGIRALRREALRELPVFNGMHRFLPTLLRLQGFKVVEAPVGHRSRTTGHSKYGVGNRLLRGIVDCLAMRWWRRRVVPARRCSPSSPPLHANRPVTQGDTVEDRSST